MKLSAENRLFYVHAVFLASLCVFGALFFKTNQTYNDTGKWVDHTQNVLLESHKILVANNDLQMAVTDYLLMSNSAFFSELNLKRELVMAHAQKLEQLTVDNERQQTRIKKLRALINERLVVLKSYHKSEITKQDVSKGERRFLESVWNTIEDIRKEEMRLLSIRRMANNSSKKALNTIFYGSLVVGGVVLFITFFISKKYIDLRQRLLASVNLKNEVLAKRVEENIQEIGEREERYHLVLDNMLEGAQIVDHNWRYLYANAALSRQSHYTIDQLVGSKMQDLYPGIEETQLFKVMQSCIEESVPRKFENHFYYPDGTSGYYEVSIQPVKEGLFILTMDITDRKIKEIYKEQYIGELEEVLFKISHEVRSPVVKILGVSQLLELSLIEDNELPMIIDQMKNCAVLLDKYTRELSDFVAAIRDYSASDASHINSKWKNE